MFANYTSLHITLAVIQVLEVLTTCIETGLIWGPAAMQKRYVGSTQGCFAYHVAATFTNIGCQYDFSIKFVITMQSPKAHCYF